jgi:hypothetical protein
MKMAFQSGFTSWSRRRNTWDDWDNQDTGYPSGLASLLAKPADPLQTMIDKNQEYRNALQQTGYGSEVPEPKRGMWDRLLAPLGVGSYTVNNLLKDATDGNNEFHPLNDIWEGIKGANPFGSAYKEGRGQFDDVLGNMGMEKSGWRAGLGFVGDVALDPLSWVTFGAGGMAGALGKKVTPKAVTLVDEALAKKAGFTGTESLTDVTRHYDQAKMALDRRVSDRDKMFDEILNSPEFLDEWAGMQGKQYTGGLEEAFNKVGGDRYANLENLVNQYQNQFNDVNKVYDLVKNQGALFKQQHNPRDFAFGFARPFSTEPFYTVGYDNPLTQGAGKLFGATLGRGLNKLNEIVDATPMLSAWKDAGIKTYDTLGDMLSTKYIPLANRGNQQAEELYGSMFDVADRFRNDVQYENEKAVSAVEDVLKPFVAKFGNRAPALLEQMPHMIEAPTIFTRMNSMFNPRTHRFVPEGVDLSATNLDLAHTKQMLLDTDSSWASNTKALQGLLADRPELSGKLRDQVDLYRGAQELDTEIQRLYETIRDVPSNPNTNSTWNYIKMLEGYRDDLYSQIDDITKQVDVPVVQRQEQALEQNAFPAIAQMFNNKFNTGITDLPKELNTIGFEHLNNVLKDYSRLNKAHGGVDLPRYLNQAFKNPEYQFSPNVRIYDNVTKKDPALLELKPESAELANKTMKDLFDMQQQAGLWDLEHGHIKELLPNYVAHYYQNETTSNRFSRMLNMFRKAGTGTNRAKERTFDTLRQAKHNGAKPIENMAVITALRLMDTGKLKASENMIEGLKKLSQREGGDMFVKMGLSPEDAGKALKHGYNYLKDANGHVVKGFENVLLTDEGMRVLRNVFHLATDEPTQKAFSQFARRATNLWKQYATVASGPGYHLRNLMGGFAQNWLAGVRNVGEYKETLDLLHSKNLDQEIPGLGMTGNEFMDLAKSYGAIGRGQASGHELGENVAMRLKQPSKLENGLLNKAENNRVTRLGRDVGNYTENLLRLTLLKNSLREALPKHGFDPMAFKQGLYNEQHVIPFDQVNFPEGKGRPLLESLGLRGFTPGDAGNFERKGKIIQGSHLDNALRESVEKIAKFQFDYGDLTNFERNVIKPWVPFYSWLKNNTMLQLDQLNKNPRFYSTWNHGIEGMHNWSNMNEGDMEYLPPNAQLDYIPLPFQRPNAENPEKMDEVMLNPNLPMNDISKIGDIRSVASSINPFLKVPAELLTGKNIFFDQDIEPYPGATYRAPFQALAKLIPDGTLSKTTRNEVDPYTGEVTDSEARWGGVAKHLFNSFPVLNNVNRVLDTNPEHGVWQYNLSNVLLGIKPYAYDTDLLKGFYYKDQNSELKNAIERLVEEGRIEEPQFTDRRKKPRGLASLLSGY